MGKVVASLGDETMQRLGTDRLRGMPVVVSTAGTSGSSVEPIVAEFLRTRLQEQGATVNVACAGRCLEIILQEFATSAPSVSGLTPGQVLTVATGSIPVLGSLTRSLTDREREAERARTKLLAKEKSFNRERDALSAARRKLPMVPVEKDYAFEGPDGRRALGDLFAGRQQLIVYHFMFDPAWDEGCPACSFIADHFDGALAHLAARDTSFAVVSRAPIAKIERFKKRMGWGFPWLSSHGGDFNHDFRVTLDAEHPEYNYAPAAAQPEGYPREGEREGMSVFVRDGERLFHSYSTYQRGLDPFLNT